MSRLIVVSNRLPVSVVKKSKSVVFKPSAGGLATGLGSLFLGAYEGKWFGWPGVPQDKLSSADTKQIAVELGKDNFIPVHLTQSDVDCYYYGFSNRTIWPLFHYFTQYAIYDKKQWNVYRKVNEKFCMAVLKEAKPDDIVWVHDYHLLLLPQMLREKMPGLTIGFFLHIPFPSFEVFRLLPWRREILEGLLGADLIGFHIYDYARHFLSSLRNRFGLEHSFGHVHVGNRMVKVDTFPMGIDYEKFAAAVNKPGVKNEIIKNRKKLGGHKVILSVDRLDYTKGILNRLESYDHFLDTYPEYREKVVLVLVAVPSRTKVEHYLQLKRDLDELVGRVNGKHGTLGWMPVWYLYNYLKFEQLTALYNIADICLVTPVRDGMNLIAKEFVAAKNDTVGVLILSEMAGAARELSESLIVNPNNNERVVEAIDQALRMPEEEQRRRNRIMQRRLKRYDVKMWADDFMKNLSTAKDYERELLSRKLTVRAKKRIVDEYRKSSKRLILLDYDGTLRDFEMRPEDAIPDKDVLRLLIRLSEDDRNLILIISGRDRDTLDTWFKHFNIGIIAEHGVWIKEKGGEWGLIEPLANYWKDEIRPVLEHYRDRTPGSIVEEKDFSLAWHFRKAEPGLAANRARELKEEILHFTANLGIGVLEGNKVI
ncbi:MAG: bifunctional alpha,alpha-trehalose-phosphate synthase (UDP-forming)/trehalose-phosphatase, partial [Candidatus Latescibacteria bacterium]|nr:bifunctional alpha,alpha-trehalose-phosphate synthase (UDP-forming)/trehalose-phosphatase [Candidatus Latescibacterota bacterium]